MSILLEPKLPGEVRRYRHDWSGFLDADTIASQTTTSTDVTIDDSDIDVGAQSITFVVSGGTDGTALVTQEITTAAGDVEIETFILSIGVEEPVTLGDAKAQCRMCEDDSEDIFISSLRAPARAYVERVSRCLFVGGERTAVFSQWGDYLEIWRRPITAVTEITYSVSDDPLDDVEYTGFAYDLNQFPLRIYPALGGAGFPTIVGGQHITVTYTAGAVDPSSEEYLIGKRAMLLLIGFWFDNRGEGPLTEDQERTLNWCLEPLCPLSAY